ncbi:MAG: S9 family peptidase [Tannerellaceae bacterium]|jgi:dipeptidyl aminopeptidase/acylaminoacyl peptidase|nr:S9 family peptidase [Tannerellaceae bacterium]
MNKSTGTIIMAATVLLSACAQESRQKTGEQAPLIERPVINVSNGLMTPEILQSLSRVGGARLSPDGTKVLYGVTFMSIEQNKGNRELFVVNIDGSDKKQITRTPQSEQNAVWINGGEQIAFLYGGQIWVMNADGSDRRQVSNYKESINEFLLSPDESRVLFYSNIPYGKRVKDIHPDLPKATGRVIDDLMYRHWDEWVEAIPHPFVASFSPAGTMGEATDLLEGEPYEAPMKPHSGIDDFAWSLDGKLIAYACRKKTGVDYTLSTNSDIYIYNMETKQTRNLTDGMPGYDTQPAFSPDGKYIAWVSQERDGYESDKHRIFIADLAGGEKTYLTSGFDYNGDNPKWLPDSKSLYFICPKDGLLHIWQVDLNKQLRQLTNGQYDFTDYDIAAGKMIALRQSMESPAEVFTVNSQNGEAKEISFENKAIYDQLTTGKSVSRLIKTTDGKDMLTWVIYPPNFDPEKKYPALLYCVGGPQNMISQGFSYRWNFQIMAANDYIIVAPNRRGLPGFGQEWLEQISGDYTGQNMKDYFSAIDELAKEPYVDENRLGAVGASYGGFSVYWLAGNHNKRFKAFVAHAGLFNMEQQYLETEEMWFANWDMGGPYWEKENKTAQRTFANSPHKFVDKWDTPILVSHGELDYRVPVSQGLAAFNAAKLRGVPAELLVYPDENHWILSPQNGVLFQREFFNWLDRWLKT